MAIKEYMGKNKCIECIECTNDTERKSNQKRNKVMDKLNDVLQPDLHTTTLWIGFKV